MFTGIIEAVGRIAAREQRGVDARLRIEAGRLDMSDVRLGDSIAVSGVCLTVIARGAHEFSADVSAETLERTTLGGLAIGAGVNLEKALTPTTRLGGHLLSGHVDGVGELAARREQGRSLCLSFRAPPQLARYIAAKGSIGVEGVSLTVNTLRDNPGFEFEVNIVPHTRAETTLGSLKPGHAVNLEVDILARYLERLLLGERSGQRAERLSQRFLREHGFLDKPR